MKRCKAYSLVEVLLVLVIIGILVSFFIPKMYSNIAKKNAVRALLEDTHNCLNFLISQYSSNITSPTFDPSKCIKSQYTLDCAYSGDVDNNTLTVSCTGKDLAKGAVCTVSIAETNVSLKKNCSGY
jgi:prepilin-type N-terminal cleavage/methylation domain-containing protein